MKFIIGIGNHGREYERTRHNAGFGVLDALARGRQARWSVSKDWKAETAGLGNGVFLLKPTTFVNRAGECAAVVVREGGEGASNEVLLVCDDVNLDLGKLRLRRSGSAGGHHGLESVIGGLGSEDFARLRLGVRRSQMPEDLTAFVLERFSTDEQKQVVGAMERAALICEAWAAEGFDAAEKRLSRLQSINNKGEVE